MSTTRFWLRAALGVTVAVTLSGCGGGTSPGQAPVTRTLDPAQRDAINACLQAAGLPTPTAVRQTVAPGDTPGDGQLADPEVRAALEACGIEVPTPAPAPSNNAG